jgi:hypothetical protein
VSAGEAGLRRVEEAGLKRKTKKKKKELMVG